MWFVPREILLSFAAAALVQLCAIAAGAEANPPAAARASSPNRPPLQIAPGTIIPVRLDHGFSSKSTRVGQAISARVMQDVPLANGEKLPEGARVTGVISAVSRASGNAGGQISFRFTKAESHHEPLAVATNLRAVASPMEALYAQTPEASPGFGTPYEWSTFDLIGGDVKYGYGGPVTDSGSQTVGRGTLGGVLSRVRANADGGCRGPLGEEDRPQALWVFSADACGVYGMPEVRIVHSGRSDPNGEITLAAEAGDVNVRSGSGMLLRVQ